MKNLKKMSLILLLVSGVGLNFGLQANSAFSQPTETKEETIENQQKCMNHENHQMMGNNQEMMNHKNHQMMGNNHEMIMGENAEKCKNQEMMDSNKPMNCCSENKENNPKLTPTN